MFRRFTKNKEDFTCENCHKEVTGNGYTNHCPYCLYSKHVDIFPGDRFEECHGLMKPTDVEKEKTEYIVTHTCIKCGYKKRNKVSPDDNFDVLAQIQKDKELL